LDAAEQRRDRRAQRGGDAREPSGAKRFTPPSYFGTCWNVTPSRSAGALCEMRPAWRWMRMLPPTSTSTALGSFGDIVFIRQRVHTGRHAGAIRYLPLRPPPRHASNDSWNLAKV